MAKAEMEFEVRLDGLELNLDQYFGLWAMEPERFASMAARVQEMDLGKHVRLAELAGGRGEASSAAGGGDRGYEVTRGGVAVIEVVGTMTKYGASLASYPGSVAVSRAVRDAAADDTVGSILLRVDSPGGSVAGTGDLADAVWEARERKRVVAQIEDLGASGAYWVASQAEEVVANASALVGSIGTYMVVRDYSGLAQSKGIRTYVLHAGEMKGAGIEGTEVTEAQLEDFQRVVNQLNEEFLKGVSRGRGKGVEWARKLADGRVHVAGAALGLGLVDRIGGFEETLDRVQRGASGRSGPSGRSGAPAGAGASSGGAIVTAGTADGPTEETVKMEKATFEELKLIPGVTSEFVVKAQEQGWTLDQAQSAWMEQQAREKAAAEARARELEEQLAAAKSKPGLGLEKGLGVQKGSSSEDAPGGFEDPVAEFDARVRAKMASGAGRMKAIAAVSKADPALHQAYLLATQPNRASRRLVEDRGEEAGIV